MLCTFFAKSGLKLFVLLFIINRVCHGLRCYTGISHKKTVFADDTDELTEVQCSRKYQHEQQYVEQTGDILSTKSINVSYSLHSSDVDEDNQDAPTDILNCLIFYNSATDVADFACDHDNICAHASSTKQTSICHKGIRGSLFCCQSDLCNGESYTRHLSPPQAATICYNGTNDGKFNLNEIHCPTSWCYQSATFAKNGRILEQKFGCEDKCTEQEFELNGAICRENNLHGGMRERVCYCSEDRCNSVIHPIMSGSSDTEPGRFPHPVPPHMKMHDSDYDYVEHLKKRWTFTTAWVGAALLILLVASIVLLILRCRQRRANKVLFNYSQLNSEAAEHEGQKEEKAILA